MKKIIKNAIIILLLLSITVTGAWSLFSENLMFGSQVKFFVSPGLDIFGEVKQGDLYFNNFERISAYSYIAGGETGTADWVLPDIILLKSKPTITYSIKFSNTENKPIRIIITEPLHIPAAFTFFGGVKNDAAGADIYVLAAGCEVEFLYTLTLVSFKARQDVHISFNVSAAEIAA